MLTGFRPVTPKACCHKAVSFSVGLLTVNCRIHYNLQNDPFHPFPEPFLLRFLAHFSCGFSPLLVR
jgi:hypothetical protein